MSASRSVKYSLAVAGGAGSVGPAHMARRVHSRPNAVHHLLPRCRGQRLDRRPRSRRGRGVRIVGGHRRRDVRAPGGRVGIRARDCRRHLPARVPRHRRDRLRTARRAGARPAPRDRGPAVARLRPPVAHAGPVGPRTPVHGRRSASLYLLQSRLACVTRAHARAGARQRLVRRRARRGPGAPAGGFRGGDGDAHAARMRIPPEARRRRIPGRSRPRGRASGRATGRSSGVLGATYRGRADEGTGRRARSRDRDDHPLDVSTVAVGALPTRG